MYAFRFVLTLLALAWAGMVQAGEDLTSLLAAPVPNGTEAEFSTGRVFLFGNDLGSPIQLAYRDSTVLVNGYQVYPKARPEVGPVTAPSTVVSQFTLLEERTELQRRLEAEGKPPAEVQRAVLAFLEQSPLVASVTDVTETTAWVAWTNGSGLEISIKSPLPPIVRPRQSDEARKKFIEITKLLEMDTLVFFGNCGDFTLPAIPKGRFRAAQDEIQLAAHFGNPDELATQWQGKVLPLPFAKEVCQPGSIDQLKKER